MPSATSLLAKVLVQEALLVDVIEDETAAPVIEEPTGRAME